LWASRYHETTVHWALLRRGETLWLSPNPIVEQDRGKLALPKLLVERRDWGRLFAYTRAREIGWLKRLGLAAGTLLLPLVLVARQMVARLEKRRAVGAYLRAFPVIVLLQAAWSYGECKGYLTGRP